MYACLLHRMHNGIYVCQIVNCTFGVRAACLQRLQSATFDDTDTVASATAAATAAIKPCHKLLQSCSYALVSAWFVAFRHSLAQDMKHAQCRA